MFSCPLTIFKIIWLSNLLALSALNADYFWNVSCALNYISTSILTYTMQQSTYEFSIFDFQAQMTRLYKYTRILYVITINIFCICVSTLLIRILALVHRERDSARRRYIDGEWELNWRLSSFITSTNVFSRWFSPIGVLARGFKYCWVLLGGISIMTVFIKQEIRLKIRYVNTVKWKPKKKKKEKHRQNINQ